MLLVSYVLGVEAYKGGWVALRLANGAVDGCQLYGHISELIRDHSEAGVIGVDIPIGLPKRGQRQADLEARRFVGPRRSSVFPTPPRAVLEADSYENALAQAHALGSRESQSRALPWRRRSWRWRRQSRRTSGSLRFTPKSLFERWLGTRSNTPRSRGMDCCSGASSSKQTG